MSKKESFSIIHSPFLLYTSAAAAAVPSSSCAPLAIFNFSLARHALFPVLTKYDFISPLFSGDVKLMHTSHDTKSKYVRKTWGRTLHAVIDFLFLALSL
jgi:hypothetical protein